MIISSPGIRYGFFPHHTNDCKLELRLEDGIKRSYWCESHRQWCYEYPIQTTNVYADGTTYRINRPADKNLKKVENSDL